MIIFIQIECRMNFVEEVDMIGYFHFFTLNFNQKFYQLLLSRIKQLTKNLLGVLEQSSLTQIFPNQCKLKIP